MNKNQKPVEGFPEKIGASLILLLSAIESFFSIQHLLALPSDTDNVLLLGLSLPRLIVFLFLGLAIIACLFTGMAIHLNQKVWNYLHTKVLHHRKSIAIGFALIAIIFGCFAFLPAYRMGHYQAYFERLKPVILWIFLFSVQLLVYLGIIFQSNKHSSKSVNISGKGFISFLFFMLIFFIIIVIIGLTNWGITPIVRFWEKTGVPILSGQSYIAWITGIFLIILLPAIFPCSENFSKTISKYRWLFFISIWIISAILWTNEPIQFNHFNPGPYPPNQQHYPNSDAQYYDLSAQRALLGQDQYPIDKPLYSALLLAYHLLAGQNSNAMIQIQTALFAVFPAILFLLGIRLHHPYTGLIAALLANFRVINSIAAQTWIWKTSSPKLMMTEFPTAILLLLLTITLIGWFSSEKNRLNFAIASGGILALATMMRHNNWIFLPMIIVFSLIALWKQKRFWLKSVLVFTLFIYISSSPILIFNKINTGQPFTFLTALNGSIIKQRIDPILHLNQETPSQETPSQETPSQGTPSQQTSSQQTPSQETPSQQTSSQQTPSQQTPSQQTPSQETPSQETSSQETSNQEANSETNATEPSPPNVNLDSDFDPGRIYAGGTSPQPSSAVGQTEFILINPFFDNMTRHFFHNLISTGLSLPVSTSFDSLSYFLKESSFVQLWDIEWNGKLPLISWILLIFDFALVAIALTFSWQKWRWAGLTPLAIMITYYAGNAFANTSGGRYLIPVDWVYYFYFAMGIVLSLLFLANRLFSERSMPLQEYKTIEITKDQARFQPKTSLPIAVLFFVIVLFAALGLNGFHQKYPDYTTEQILDNLVINQEGVDQTAILPYVEAVQNGDLMVVHGSLLYPLYLNYQQDEDFEVDTQKWEEKKPALIFTVLSNGRDFISGRLQMDSAPQALPDGAEAIVFTCSNYEAYALLIFTENENILLHRTDTQSITCLK